MANVDVIRVNGFDNVGTVEYSTISGTAVAGVDFVSNSGSVTFGGGEVKKTIAIDLIPSQSAPTAQFNVRIDQARGAALNLPRTATVNLVADKSVLPNYRTFSNLDFLQLNGAAKQSGSNLVLNSGEGPGSVFYSKPLSLEDDNSFRAFFGFEVSHSLFRDIFGFVSGGFQEQGMAFVIQSSSVSALGDAGTAAGVDGLSDESYSVIFSGSQIAIVSGSSSNILASAQTEFDFDGGQSFYIWIDYNGNSNSLSVFVSQGSDAKPQFLNVETTVDISGSYFVGFAGGVTSSLLRTAGDLQLKTWRLDQIDPAEDPPTPPEVSIQAVTLVPETEGLRKPTSMSFLPDGSMLIAQQDGRVRVAVNGTVLPTDFIDLSDVVNEQFDRGLADVAVHPKFSEGFPYVYLCYTYEGIPAEEIAAIDDPLGGPDGEGNRVTRVVMYEADAATGYRTAIESSEVVIVGKNSTRQ